MACYADRVPENGTSRKQHADEEEVRVVLLGKTGSGKSSLGNTLLGHDAFGVARGMSSGTDKCQFSEAQRLGVKLQVTDTPGVCDTHRTELEVLQEVGKSLAVASPGPHVILMVLRCDRRFTQEEYDAYITLKRLFGEDICNYMIVVFVGIDTFGDCGVDRDAGLIREVESSPSLLQSVITDAGGRFCGVDNRASRDHREQLANMILTRIQSLKAQNQWRYFSSDLFDDVYQHVKIVIQKNMRESYVTYAEALKKTREDIVEEKAEPSFFRKLVDTVGNRVLGVLRTLLGDAMTIGKTAVASHCSLM